MSDSAPPHARCSSRTASSTCFITALTCKHRAVAAAKMLLNDAEVSPASMARCIAASNCSRATQSSGPCSFSCCLTPSSSAVTWTGTVVFAIVEKRAAMQWISPALASKKGADACVTAAATTSRGSGAGGAAGA
eukprot:CAMPEP_0180126690 /NCGR_PEP_ID=MMETSP0986-20121125/5844_1 /TAXON_ID=697907 /ORGANISM="non described non described, Strain CCMP2293" /LENGTH=133 /DNA_ID=CAMNT_0022066163 /DNA_START=195 /DNA_END=592 /DNA_ORIENTATION=-